MSRVQQLWSERESQTGLDTRRPTALWLRGLRVNYRVRDDAVIFRTDPGSKLDAATKGAWVAFEVAKVDAWWQEGWSILVKGRAEHVEDPGELERLRQLSPLRPWARAGRSPHRIWNLWAP